MFTGYIPNEKSGRSVLPFPPALQALNAAFACLKSDEIISDLGQYFIHYIDGKTNMIFHARLGLSLTLLLSFSAIAAPADVEQNALQILRDLINYRSTANSGQIKPMADYLHGKFLAGGFKEEDIRFIDVEPDTGALVVRYRGSSITTKPILLMAHMDVVDALREDWTTDPFVLTEIDGYLYGRGTLDNKGGATALTATLLRLKAAGYMPKRDLILVVTGDEETTAYSMRALIEDHKELVDAEFALNSDAGGGSVDHQGNPLSYSFQAAEKSYMTFEITIRNNGGHSSQPRLDNAIYELADALKKIQTHRFPVMANDITLASFAERAKSRTGEMAQAMRAFAENPGEETADYFYDKPSFVGKTRTTCIPTLLNAGHAENALPQSATATVNCRVFPGVEVHTILETLISVVANPNAEIKAIGDSRSSPASPLNPFLVDVLTRVVRRRLEGVSVIPSMSSGATDAVETRAGGIPTYGVGGIVIGPDDHRAHGQDERIKKAALFDALDHWYELLKELTDS